VATALASDDKTCRTCGRPATHWYYVYVHYGEFLQLRLGCEGHAQSYIGVQSERGTMWGVIGEDANPEIEEIP
jgi:hypothetical protein